MPNFISNEKQFWNIPHLAIGFRKNSEYVWYDICIRSANFLLCVLHINKMYRGTLLFNSTMQKKNASEILPHCYVVPLILPLTVLSIYIVSLCGMDGARIYILVQRPSELYVLLTVGDMPWRCPHFSSNAPHNIYTTVLLTCILYVQEHRASFEKRK